MTKPLPIETILAKRLCTGCGACSVLAQGRVQMRDTEDCNRRPDFSEYPQGLTDLELAAQCPAQDTKDRSLLGNETETEFGPVLAVYEGFAIDPEIRFKGSSGGAVTALALASMEDDAVTGVLHVKASKQDPLANEASVSRSRAALLEGSGSRYAPASVADALPKILQEKGETTVIGKPCDISGVNAVAEQDPLIAANVGAKIAIFCAGTPSHAGTESLLKKLGAPKTRLEGFRYRGHGWPGAMTAWWRDDAGLQQEASTSYEDGWGNTLQEHRQWRCYVCTDHTGEAADISVGDPWQRPSGEDGHGRSLIIVRTMKGAQLLERARKAGHLKAEPVNPNILAKAQPNLVAAKGNAFGRSLALNFAGIPAPRRQADSLACWFKLSTREKVSSILGTWKRVARKQLYRNDTFTWKPSLTNKAEARGTR